MANSHALVSCTFFFLSILFSLNCTQESDRLSTSVDSCYARRDTLAFIELIQSRHRRTRSQINNCLEAYLKSRADTLEVTRDEIESKCRWLTSIYDQETDIHDLSGRWRLYSNWDTSEIQKKVSLDSALALCLALDSLSPRFDSLKNLRLSYDSLGDSFALGVIDYNLGNVYFELDSIDSGLAYHRRCRNICRQADYVPQLAASAFVCAGIYNSVLSDFQQSERLYLAAGRNFEKVGEYRQAAYVNMGRAYNYLCFYQNRPALDLLSRTFNILREHKDDPGLASAYNYAAEAYLNEKSYDSAIYYCELSYELRREIAEHTPPLAYYCGYSLSTLGVIYHDREILDSAIQYLEEADGIFLGSNHEAGLIVNRTRMASCLVDQGAYDSASTIFNDVLDRGLSFEDVVFSIYGLANCDYRNHRVDKAIEKLKSCISMVEQSNMKLPVPELKSGMLSDKIGFYHLLSLIYQDKFKKSGDINFADSALLFLERSRARALLDQFSSSRAGRDQEYDRIFDKIVDLQRQLYLTEVNHDSIMHWIKLLEDSLHLIGITTFAENPNMVDASTSESIGIDRIQKSLNGDSTLVLEYLISNHGCAVMAIRRDTFQVIPIMSQADSLAERVNNYISDIAVYPAGETDDCRESAIKLGNLLLPFGEYGLNMPGKIIVIPSGVLNKLPFEALCDPEGRYFGSKFAFSYCPSLTVMERLYHRSSDRSFNRAVVFEYSPSAEEPGGAGPSDIKDNIESPLQYLGDLSPLPYISEESKAISDIYGSETTTMFVGNDATESNFRNAAERSPDIIHIAAHGLIDINNPRRSGIILSHGDNNDGILQPYEIIRLSLPASLVFISSCESGTGRLVPGEGRLNLARPFLVAGAQTVIASQWNIDDKAGSEFIEMFYSILHDGHSVSEALQMAKIRFMNSERSLYRHPYFWAPYIVIGIDR